ncbi:TonB-dependent receptor domain-containing protein, partial [Polymorphobacter multimanifer]|uniref:TonB-dependent receptor domain-containing protein n=1 Tax=Polymorphobacter multimanifer TaxID=1070431 RepID=UPI0035710204
FGGHVEAEGQFGEQAGFRLNVAGEAGDTYLDGVTAERIIAAAAFNFKPSESTPIFLDGNFLRSSTDGDVLSDPALFDTAGRLQTKLANTNYNFGSPEKYDVLNKTINFRIVQQSGPDFTLVAAAQYADYRDIFFSGGARGRIDANREVDFFYFPGLFTSNDLGASLVATYKFQTGAVAHKLTVTGQYTNGKTGSGVFGSGTVGRYNIDTGPLAPVTPPGALNRGADQFSDEYGVLVSYMVEPTSWSRILGGIRYSSISTARRQAGATVTVSEPRGSKTTPFVGIMIDPPSRLSLYAHYAQGLERGSRAPVDATNPNILLPPVVSEQYEAG